MRTIWILMLLTALLQKLKISCDIRQRRTQFMGDVRYEIAPYPFHVMHLRVVAQYDQSLLVRGRSTEAPVLLHLAGGPGGGVAIPELEVPGRSDPDLRVRMPEPWCTF